MDERRELLPRFSGSHLSLFLVWQDREDLAELCRKPTWWGLAVLAFGLSRISLIFVLAGIVVLFLGWHYLSALWFPLAVLLLMVPVPAIVLNGITAPLQTLASFLATTMLSGLGVPVLREGNVLHLPALDLGVAEACSGLRSLISLSTLSVIYGYFMDSRVWVRIVLVLFSVPIAVFANGLRIVGTGLVAQYWDPEKAHGFFHTFSGFLVFALSIALLSLIHASLCWITRVKSPPGPAVTKS